MEARDVTKHPTIYKTVSTTKSYWAQNVDGAKVDNMYILSLVIPKSLKYILNLINNMYFNIFLENMHVYVYIYSPYILKYPKNIVVVISGITFNFSIFPLCLLVFSKLYSRIYRSFYFV